MTSDRAAEIRDISWRDVFPWLSIVRSFGLALSLPMLLLATAGAVVAPLGWKISGAVFVTQRDREFDPAFAHLVASNQQMVKQFPSFNGVGGDAATLDPVKSKFFGKSQMAAVFERMVAPYWLFMTTSHLSVTKFAYLLFGTLWTLMTWGLAGGAITRIAVVRLGRGNHVGLGQALRFAIGRLRAFVLAPLFPFAGVLMVIVPCSLAGLLMRFDLVALMVALVWPLILIGGFIIAVLMLGAMFGWPLMFGAISAEEMGDEFEALHRSFSFTFQRPLHYLFYVFVALVVGALAGTFVNLFSHGVTSAASWAVSWGLGNEGWQRIAGFGDGNHQAFLVSSTSRVLRFWNSAVHVIASAAFYSFFWCAVAAIYLLLRQNVDETEFDEVYFVDEVESMVQTPATSVAASTTSESSVATPTAEPLKPVTPSSEQAQG